MLAYFNYFSGSLANLGINRGRLGSLSFGHPSRIPRPSWLPAEVSAGPIGPVFVYINNFFSFFPYAAKRGRAGAVRVAKNIVHFHPPS